MVANGFEGVPWMVGGGAKHSANLGRVLAYAATSGAEGVISPGDLKVSPSAPTPDGFVHVATGAVVIRNRAGAAQSESYIARAPLVSDVPVGSTGSTGRSDLVYVRVKDPQYTGQAPLSVTDGPFVFPEIITVPAGVTSAQQVASLLNAPVYAIARIDIPPNTTAITAGMIKELRELALPRSRREMFSGTAGATPVVLNSTAFVDWPTVFFDVKAPLWATHANLRVDMGGVTQNGPGADMQMRAHIGSSLTSVPVGVDNDAFVDGLRHTFLLVAGGELNTADRGNIIRLKVTAKVEATDAAHTGRYGTDRLTHIGYDIQFDEKVV